MNFNNKILLISGIILILFAIILFAGNVIAKDQGTKANDDSASYGKRGLTQNITYKGEDGNNYVLVVKNGLIVQTTQQENDQNNNSLWWNTSWDKRREISNLSGYNTIINITYDSNMQADFDDVRFLYNETEFIFELINKVDGEWATYKITLDGANVIQMYYGNSLDSSKSQSIQKYLTSPVSEYWYDEISGTAVDDAQNSMDATNINAVEINKEGRFNRAFEYDGTIDERTQLNAENYMRCTSGSCVVSAWVKIKPEVPVHTHGCIISKSNHYEDGNANGWSINTYDQSNGSVYVIVSNANTQTVLISSGVNVTDGQWHNVIAQFCSSGQYLYIDGVLSSSNPTETIVSGFSSTGATPVVTGAMYRYTHSAYWSPLNGYVDEVYMRNGTINETEAKIIGNITFYPNYVLNPEQSK